MKARHWFISAGVSVAIWVLAMGQSWALAGWKGWKMLVGYEDPTWFIVESAVARILTVALIGFAAFSLFKGFSSLKDEE